MLCIDQRYPKGPIRLNKQCPAGSCGEGNKKCEGELVFGYLTAKALHGAHYHDNMNGFSNHFWIFQSDWVKMGCDLVSVKTFQSYIYNPNGKVAAQGPILSRCAGKGDGKDPNTGAATSYMDWPNYRKEGAYDDPVIYSTHPLFGGSTRGQCFKSSDWCV